MHSHSFLFLENKGISERESTMRATAIPWVASLAGFALGQTPAGFEPAVEANLAVIFGDKAVAEPGTSFTAAGRHRASAPGRLRQEMPLLTS